MPAHSESRLLPHKKEALFDLIADVAKYPEFLPWCLGARVTATRPDGFDADLIIGFKFFRESFTSRVTLDRPNHIHVDYIRGPLKYLKNDWHFEKAGEGGGQGTLVHSHVDFAFKNPLFQHLMGALFEDAVSRMISAFETRANAVLGKS